MCSELGLTEQAAWTTRSGLDATTNETANERLDRVAKNRSVTRRPSSRSRLHSEDSKSGRLELEADDVLTNPTILVEVLSASTEQYDRGLKWESYQRISSLADYVLVSQAETRIEHYQRGADGSWTYRAAGAGERVTLSSGVALVVDEIFAGMLELPGD